MKQFLEDILVTCISIAIAIIALSALLMLLSISISVFTGFELIQEVIRPLFGN